MAGGAKPLPHLAVVVVCLLGAVVGLSQGPGPRTAAADFGIVDVGLDEYRMEGLLRDRGLLESKVEKSEANKKLFGAAKSGNTTIAEEALNEGANVEAKFGNEGRTALQVAASRDHLEVVELLIRAGANLDECSERGETPVAEACVQGNLKVLLTLLRAGASPHKPVPFQGQQNKVRNLEAWERSDLAQALVNAGLEVEGTIVHGRSPLMLASLFAHPQVVEVLLKADASFNCKNEFGYAALHYACIGSQPEAVAVAKLLLDAGAGVNEADSAGDTPLFHAMGGGDARIVKTLLEAGAATNVTNQHGETPLFYSAYAKEFKEINVLLDAGAEVAVVDSKGNTPLFLAARNGNVGAAKALVQAGVNVNATNSAGETALFESVPTGGSEMVKYLLKAGANVNAANYDGETPLLVAAFWGNFKAVKILMESGADPTAVDNDGKTPFASLCGCEMHGKRKKNICPGRNCSHKQKRASLEMLLSV